MADPELPPSLRLAEAVRAIGRGARRLGLEVPGFRAPPRLPGAARTIRRGRRGAVVAVALVGRPWPAVLADLVEGVVVANRLQGRRAHQVRQALWGQLAAAEAGPVPGGAPRPRPEGAPARAA